MTRLVLASVVFLCTGCLGPKVVSPTRQLPAALDSDPERFDRPPNGLPPVPQVEAFALPNGLRVAHVQSRTAALVDVTLFVRCGRIDDAPGHPAVTEDALSLAFTAGAGALDESAQRTRSNALAFQPRVTIDDAESWASFTVRSEDLASTLYLVAEAMRAPRYGEAAVKRHLERLDGIVQLESTRATRRLWLAKQRSVYEGVPSLTQARSRESIALTTSPVLAARAAACFGGENLALAVSGDVDGRALREALQPLAELPRGQAMVHAPSQVKPRKRFVALVPSSSEQVRVTLSGPGLPPGGHRFAAYVLIGILRSELEAELRRFGEVYSVRMAIDVGPGDGATWLSFGTRREVAFEATQRAIQIIEWWWRQWPVTPNAMNRLRDQIRGHPPGGHDAAEMQARAALQDLALHDGRPWEEQLAMVAMEDVRAFFERSFRPDQLQVLVTGPFDESAPWVELNVP